MDFVERVKKYYDWRKTRPKDKIGETPLMYQKEINLLNYMNNFHEYRKKNVLKVDSGKYVFNIDTPKHNLWDRRCEEKCCKIVN